MQPIVLVCFVVVLVDGSDMSGQESMMSCPTRQEVIDYPRSVSDVSIAGRLDGSLLLRR